jgi:hypothetical protein
MKDPNSSRTVFSQVKFIVDQRWEFPNGPQFKEVVQKLGGYCYEDLGVVRLNCRYDKDMFIVGENVLMHIDVDNSARKSDINNITCSLVQTLKIKMKSSSNSETNTKTITSVVLPGLARGRKREGVNSMQVTLPIKTKIDIEATSNGTLVHNKFTLMIEAQMASTPCCDPSPTSELEIKIFNKQFNQVMTPPQFPNWNPQVMNPYICSLTPHTRMTQEFKNQMYMDQKIEYPPLN